MSKKCANTIWIRRKEGRKELSFLTFQEASSSERLRLARVFSIWLLHDAHSSIMSKIGKHYKKPLYTDEEENNI